MPDKNGHRWKEVAGDLYWCTRCGSLKAVEVGRLNITHGEDPFPNKKKYYLKVGMGKLKRLNRSYDAWLRKNPECIHPLDDVIHTMKGRKGK